MKYLLGLDLGTSGVKAILMDCDGKIIESKTRKYTPDFFEGGRVEQHPGVWFENTLQVITDIVKSVSIPVREIVSLSISGQMHGSIFLDSDGEVIRPALLWNDTSTSSQVERIKREVTVEGLLKHVHNSALEGFTLPKILWLQENEPHNFEKLDTVLLPKDYINYKLTNVLATEVSDASGTLAFNSKSAKFEEEVLGKLNINKEIFPKVLKSTDVVGNLTEEIAELTGLSENTQVIAGGADNSCAAIGNGLLNESQSVISLGTSGTVISMLKELPEETNGGAHLFSYSYPGSYYAMGVMLCAAESLNYLKRVFYQDDEIVDLIRLAEDAPVGSNRLIFLPYIFGERCPHQDTIVRGGFFGLSATTDKSSIVRSVLEGVAYGIADLFEIVNELSEGKITEVYITGGGAKSDLWIQIIADVLNRNVRVLDIEEGPAFGAAMIAGVGVGLINFEEFCQKRIGIKKSYEPNYENYKRYLELRVIFSKLYESNKENHRLLSQIQV